MSILEIIKRQALESRKARDKVKSALLITIIGDAEKVGKDGGNRAPTDEEVIKVLKKFSTNIAETHAAVVATNDTETLVALNYELEIVNSLLPKQMNATELEVAVAATITEVGAASMKDMGKVMKGLKDKYGGTYDGAQANALVKQVLS